MNPGAQAGWHSRAGSEPQPHVCRLPNFLLSLFTQYNKPQNATIAGSPVGPMAQLDLKLKGEDLQDTDVLMSHPRVRS